MRRHPLSPSRYQYSTGGFYASREDAGPLALSVPTWDLDNHPYPVRHASGVIGIAWPCESREGHETHVVDRKIRLIAASSNTPP